MAEAKVKVDEKVVEVISKRVRESVDKDLKEWSDTVYKELKDDVRDHLSALRDHQDALNVRMMQHSKKLDDVMAKIGAIVAPKEPLEEEEPPKVEAKVEEKAPEETLEDVIVVCTHGGKGERLGFTEDDRKGNLKFCPECGRRIQWS